MHHRSSFHLILAATILAGLAWGFQPVPLAQAAAIVVNSRADTQANDGACTLREAIINANNDNQSGSTDCAAGSGADSITFDPLLSGTITLNAALAPLGDLTIHGAARVTISGNDAVRVFDVNTLGTTLTLDGLTITHGYHADEAGAIFIADGITVTISNSTIRDNKSQSATMGFGGAIYNMGTLNITDSTLQDNTAKYYGGAIDSMGSMTITHSTLKGNSAQYGGFISDSGSLTITDSTFDSNTALGWDGGGIWIHPGPDPLSSPAVTVTNSTFTGNQATGGFGGAIKAEAGTLNVTNSTFSANSASLGGAIFNYIDNTSTLINSTFSGNIAPTEVYPTGGGIYNMGVLNFTNTIIANSTGGDCTNDGGTIGTNTNNLVEDGSCPAGLTVDPMLGPLADNGGPTQTMALSPGSLAINAGNDATCAAAPVSAKDQRGITRPQGAHCDIGAYEFRLLCFVDADALGLNDGSSWANAYTSLQSTLGASTCTEIWVAAGTYRPTTPTGRSATFQLKNGVALYGGFAGTETLRQERNLQTNPTILSGEIGAAGITDNSYHVVIGATGAILDGFMITGGNANSSPANLYGGGMYNVASSPSLANVTFNSNTAFYAGGGMYNANGSNPTLTDVTFSSNTATSGLGGGGMYNDLSSPILNNVTFTSNTALYGGGMYNGNSSNPKLMNVTFSSNNVGFNGGGMENSLSSPTLTNVTFNGNSASAAGGGGAGAGMNNNSSSPKLTNVTFTANSGVSGGGMYNFISSPSLTNVTFSGNSATTGGAMRNYQDSNPVIKDSLFWGDGSEIASFDSAPVIDDSLIQGGCPVGATCNVNILNADPLLGALANNGGFTRTMALPLGSPAIDVGNNLTCALTDQRGVTRPRGSACDMGAYEYVDPTDVSLASFTARVEKKLAAGNGRSALLSWETASEVDNLGFNLYRAASLDGARVKLNPGLIPTLVPPGSLFGAAYTYKDTGLVDGKTYYYWLEAVDIHGGKELTGPAWVKLVAGKTR